MKCLPLTRLFLLFVLVQFACNREPEPFPTGPQNVNLPHLNFEVEQITASKATITAVFTSQGNVNIRGYGCVWSRQANPTIDLPTRIDRAFSPPDSISFQLTGLEPEAGYHVRVYLILAKDTLYFDCPWFQMKAHWVNAGIFPGLQLSNGGGFALGENVYVGTGCCTQTTFWGYNQTSSTWTNMGPVAQQMAPLSGGVAGFSIGNTGYFGTGYYSDTIYTKSFWSFNEQNGWQTKQEFPGSSRQDAVGFAIGSKGYIGLGYNYVSWLGTSTYFDDFWEYDRTTNNWSTVPSFPGEKRWGAVAFVIKDRGYVGYGYNESGVPQNDFWEFDATKPDPWSVISFNGSDIPASVYEPFTFVINNKAYLGNGADHAFWEFNPDSTGNRWKKLPNLPAEMGDLYGAVGIGLLNRAIVVGGDAIHYWFYYP